MSRFLHLCWTLFNNLPESTFKMRSRFFMAFSPIVPVPVRRMSPIRASTYHHSPRPGDIVIDAGAFPGDFTIFASRKVGATGRVLAFEPHPHNFEMLKQQVSAFKCSNVECINKGLWGSDTRTTMDNKGVESTVGRCGACNAELVSLDHEMERLGIATIDFLKMDIEGAEVQALKGAEHTLRKSNAKLAAGAYHDFNGKPTREKIERLISSFGYQYVTEYPERLNTYAWKP